MKKYYQTLFLIFFCLTLSNFSQNKEYRWAIDAGSSSVLFKKSAIPSVGYRYLQSAARIGLTKYIDNNLFIAGSISNSITKDKEYLTLDGELRYDFGTSTKKIFNLISIYVFIGTSYLLIPDIVTLSFGGGGTLWLTKKIGFTSNLVYKSHGGLNFPGSHIYGSAGFVHIFSPEKHGDRRKRIWDY